MMMNSPEPSKIKSSSSASVLNANITNTPTSESPQVQESPFSTFADSLSPINTVKACHVPQGFLGLSSPPLVFKSPRISCHRETQFLERSQGTRLSSAETSQSDNGDNSLLEAPGDPRKSNFRQPLQERFIIVPLKDSDIKNDANTQNCSPPPSVDEYLADPGDIDQMYSVNPDVEQSTDAVESSDMTQSKKILSKFDRKDGPGDKAVEPLSLSEESNKVHQVRHYVEEPEKIEGEKRDVEWASQGHTKLESSLAADVFDQQYSHDSLPQCTGNEQRDHRDCAPQSMPDSLQDVKECEDYNEMVSTSHVGAENISQDGSEASLKYHGIRRRCLQFEEAASNALGSDKSGTTSSKMKMVKVSEPITSLFPQRGIGLHLNRIINAMPPGRASTTGMRLSDGLQGMKATSSISLHRVENMKRSLISSNMDGRTLVDTRNESHETDASVAADSFISESPSLTELSSSYPANVHDKRKLSPTDAGDSEEFNPPSSGKKKKKTSITTDDNGCKRCNCKKSKCLKLYCDCFAAGIYCGDACSCQGCSNKSEYQDTVLETRQQIESRNPLAFAPKIVQCTTDPSNNMEDVTTPSSARHKRGCNCKRSMCQKKYCECYQANVGCSSGCRCEGCRNIYGKKEDYVASEHALSKERVNSSVENGSDSTMHNKPEMVANRKDLSHHLSPLTPSLQCSDQGKEAAKARLLSGKYLSSPESGVNMFSKSSINSHCIVAYVERNEMLGTASYDLQMDGNNVNVHDQSSPTCDSVANVLQLTPLSNTESMSGASPFSSKAHEWTEIPPSRLSSRGCIRQLSGGSLRWRSSITPMTNIDETQYLQCPESDNRLFDIVEDETPDVLKEASTPIKSVKANSPIQKRVSPPPSHPRGIGSSSSGGLRNGRKFILQSVPSFPPLTPCADSKDNGNKDCSKDSGNGASK